jgi:signal transduction histidine kinase
MNQASQSLRLRQMQERAIALDGRLRHHREEGVSWH